MKNILCKIIDHDFPSEDYEAEVDRFEKDLDEGNLKGKYMVECKRCGHEEHFGEK